MWLAIAASAILNVIAIVYWFPWGFATAGLTAHFYDRRWRERRGKLRAGKKGLSFDGKLLAGPGDVRSALVVDAGPEHRTVALERRSGAPVRLRLRDDEEVGALMDALGRGADRERLSFVLPTLDLTLRAAVFAACAALGLGGIASLPFAAPAYGAGAIVAAIVAFAAFVRGTRTRVDVGIDGVWIEGFRVRRFVPFGEITRAEAHRGVFTGVALHLGSGELLRVPTSTQPGGDRGLAVALADRIERARAARPPRTSASAATRLGRAGRSTAEWARALRDAEASQAAADHRTAPVDRGALWTVVEDADADAASRAAAAVALSADADAEERGRLRGVAGVVAQPRLRIAIERAADSEDDAAAAEALAALEEEAEASAAARRR